jgi:predicted transcriptional regulator
MKNPIIIKKCIRHGKTRFYTYIRKDGSFDYECSECNKIKGKKRLIKMNNILMSIKPKWANRILSGLKILELRSMPPKNAIGKTVYIYETSPIQMITGCFTIEHIYDKMNTKELLENFKFEDLIGYRFENIEKINNPEYEILKSILGSTKKYSAIKIKNPIILELPLKLKIRPSQNFKYFENIDDIAY